VISDTLLTPRPILTIGRSRKGHLAHVLIEGGKVIVRTRCGIDSPVETGLHRDARLPDVHQLHRQRGSRMNLDDQQTAALDMLHRHDALDVAVQVGLR
jgi:hypothetical protein